MNISHDSQAIIEAEQLLAEAHITLNLELLDRLLHPDYVIIQPGGKVESKADVLTSYRLGDRHWQTASSDELDVRIYGNMARVIGRWTAKGTNGSQHFDYSARFLSIWIKEGGSWQNLTSQSTELTVPELK